MTRPDILVIGSGPAGLAAAAALAERKLAVSVLSPDPSAPWLNTYGVWLDEVEPLGYAPFLGHVWTDTVGHFGAGSVPLGRTYGRFDNSLLQMHLRARCDEADVVWQCGAAAEVAHHADGSSLTTKDGEQHHARLIVDATGHHSALVRRRRASSGLAFQTAYGVLGHFSASPVAPGQMLLMDFRDDFLTPAERATPTFLYAMDRGSGCYFAEETSLAHRPGLSAEVLKDRLARRLEFLGVKPKRVLEEEYVRFPMNPPLPDLTQRVIGFGGAASMVHPASGYMVALTLRHAPALADALVAGLSEADLDAAARAGWQALWSPARVRQHALYLFGLEALLKLDSAQTQSFFRAFFKLSPRKWQGYLSGTHSAAGILGTMGSMFQHAPNEVRLPLIRTALTYPLSQRQGETLAG